jgi:hypothetical protein
MSPQARERSFDELARGLASGSISRRRALRLMGAALLGGALASLGIGEAAADPPGCKRNGKRCKNNNQCCSGNCVNGTCEACPTPCGTQCCQTGELCLGLNGPCCPAAQFCVGASGSVCCGPTDLCVPRVGCVESIPQG